MEDIVYTVKEVSVLLKTNPATVYSYINAGLLPVLKLGALKVRKVALERFLEENEGKSLADPWNVTDLNVKELAMEGEAKGSKSN